jgi:3-phosphoshikimate 1-carboxyvinyltransferase
LKVKISKSRVSGTVKAPPSKSYTIRGLMCAALAEGESRIINPLFADDSAAAREVLHQLGAFIEEDHDGWRVEGGHLKATTEKLFCHDSAATLRFMTAICAAIPGTHRLTSGQSLSRRPIETLLKVLQQLGIICYVNKGAVIIEGKNLRGGSTEIRGDISSQFISSLMFLAPLAAQGITIKLTSLPESRPYLEMTIECLGQFGITVNTNDDLDEFNIPHQPYRPAEYIVEDDWSSASYLLALGAISEEVTVVSLNAKSLQGDRIMLNLLGQMGARVSVAENGITVSRSELKGITACLEDCIDLLPTVAALAALAEGESRLEGIARARDKESNRVAAVKEGLERMGMAVTETENGIIISGQPKGAVIDSKGDHRIAMAFSIIGAAVGDTVIEGAECVAKTYPCYWQDFRNLGGRADEQ